MAKIEHIKNKRGEVIYPVSKEGAIYDENGVLLSTKIATFITRLVDNLANYYLKSETYTKAEVDDLIRAIQGFTYIVVSELPTASAETMGIVYLVPSEDPQTQNVKDEYITIRSGVEGSYTYSWEQIGSTAIDLSGYVTTEALNTELAKYTTTANLTTLLAGKQDTISDLSTIRSGAAAGATAYQKPASGIPASDIASGVIPTVPDISTNITTDAASDVKTSSPKSVKTYVDAGIAAVESDLSDLADEVEAIDIGEYVMAWDGNSEPVVANIPAGVSVTYNSTTYTGTLAASASTKQKIYLVATGTTDNYDRHITVGDSTYSWVNIGTTEITLSDYATKAEVDELEAKVDVLATGKFYGFRASAQDLPEGDVPGYAYVGTASPYTIYNFDGTTWTDSGATVKQDGPKVLHLEDIEGYDETMSPAEMQQFIQDAVDYAASQGMDLQFPANKTFTIAIPERTEDSLEYTRGIYKDNQGGYGIIVPSNIDIDLNGSTIKVDTNDYWCYAIVYFDQNCRNSSIRNGAIVGDRETHIMSGVRETDEFHYGVNIRGAKNINVSSLDISELRGDGIFSEGFSELNTSVGTLKGTDFTSFSESGLRYFNAQGPLQTISTYHATKFGDVVSYVIIPPYSKHSNGNNSAFGRYYLVSYYDSEQTFISREKISWGVPLTIPTGAVYFRFAIHCDAPATFMAISSAVFWVACYLPTENVIIHKCDIHDVGRNGIVLACGRDMTVSDTSIIDVSTTNNFIGIDFENYGGDFTYNILIERCFIDTKHEVTGGAIAATCGHGITIRDCEVKQPIYGLGYETTVENVNAIATTIDFTPGSGVISSGADEMYVPTIVKDCVVDKISMTSGTIERCNILKSIYNASVNKNPANRVIFKQCRIHTDSDDNVVASTFSTAVFYDCSISVKRMPVTDCAFHNCKIRVDNFKLELTPSEFYGCEIELYPLPLMNELSLTKLVGCHIVFKSTVAYGAFNVFPYGECLEIVDNIIEEASGVTVNGALISLTSNTAVTPTIIFKRNTFKTTHGNVIQLYKKSSHPTYLVAGSYLLFDENTVNCVDAVKDFATGVSAELTVRRFNNRYISNSKLEDANIQDLWNPS